MDLYAALIELELTMSWPIDRKNFSSAKEYNTAVQTQTFVDSVERSTYQVECKLGLLPATG